MGKALWRRAFDTVEGAVGPRVEQAVNESGFATLVVVVRRGTAIVSGVGERTTRRLWHGLNLPAGSDVRRLRRQIGDLDREVRLVRHALAQATPAQELPRAARPRVRPAAAPSVVQAADDGEG